MSEFVEITDGDAKAKLSEQSVAIVDFYASWCGACRMAAPMIKRVATELSLPLFKVDAEKNPECRAMVEIENLPTVGIWKAGKFVGSICTTKEEGLKAFLKEHGL